MDGISKVSLVKKLRNRLGCSLRDAKEALEKAGWDYDRAFEDLSGVSETRRFAKSEYVRVHGPAIACAFIPQAGNMYTDAEIGNFAASVAEAIYDAAERIRG